MLKECFDFDAIKKLFARKDFSFCYDALNGAQGPYAKKVQLYCIGLLVETIDSLNHQNVDGGCINFARVYDPAFCLLLDCVTLARADKWTHDAHTCRCLLKRWAVTRLA